MPVPDSVTFVVGDKPVENFTMVERHFFKGKLLKSFTFNFPFCIPGSTNTCEQIYEFPVLTAAEGKDTRSCRLETIIVSCIMLFSFLYFDAMPTRNQVFCFCGYVKWMHAPTQITNRTRLVFEWRICCASTDISCHSCVTTPFYAPLAVADMVASPGETK